MQNKQLAGLALVVLLVAGVVIAKVMKESTSTPAPADAPTAPARAGTGASVQPATTAALPKLLDLGSTTCDACKKMAPLLEKLAKDLNGKVTVEFIDVYKDETAADKYKVDAIPTQILFDAQGKELFRHTGVYGDTEIRAKMRETGMLKE